MKTALIFYSWSGHTAQLAKERAVNEKADLFELKDKKRPGTLKAYTLGCYVAMRMKRTAIMPLSIPFDEYEKIIIMAPVWAGHPAPAINSVLDMLPEGREIEIVMVSGSGSSKCKEKVQSFVESKGCKLTGFEDILQA